MAAWILLAVIFRCIVILRQLREKYVFLEITPPQTTNISAISTTQLFTLISGLLEQRSWIHRIRGGLPPIWNNLLLLRSYKDEAPK